LVNVEKIAARYEVSAGAIYYWFNEKVKPALGEILKNDPPGPEPRTDEEVKVAQAKGERPERCDQCGSQISGRTGPIG
jgi:hypothetical protein